jgi:hypothetical protein
MPGMAINAYFKEFWSDFKAKGSLKASFQLSRPTNSVGPKMPPLRSENQKTQMAGRSRNMVKKIKFGAMNAYAVCPPGYVAGLPPVLLGR